MIVRCVSPKSAIRRSASLRFLFVSDRTVFAKSLYETGQMSSLEWKMYNEWYIWLENILIEKMGKPSGFIYLRCLPEVSFKRLKIRSRNEESSVSLEYLEMLHKSHDDWLANKNNKKSFNSIVIDVNEDFENNESIRNHIFNQIDTFINKDDKFSNK